MSGLFGLLNLGARSLQAQQLGLEVAGHNIANVNTPGYTRQRVNLATSPARLTSIGSIGTGVRALGVQQMRSALLDGQIQGETSVRGFLEAQQAALQQGQAILGQTIDRLASDPTGAAANVGQNGLAAGLSGFFAALQNLANHPTSPTERQAVLAQAQDLATKFNQVDSRLVTLNASLNKSLSSDAGKANELIDAVAELNKQILAAENGAAGSANDLRDLRQQKIEELSRLVNVTATEQPSGAVDLAISGATVVTGVEVTDRLEVYDAGGGQMLVRTQTAQTPLTLTGGSMQGTIEARDGALKSLRDDLNGMAAQLITEVNTLHRAGFSLTGSTGADLFTGTNAGDIGVNAALVTDPTLLQAAGVNGAPGDNQVALALAQLANKAQAGLSNQTFSQRYAQTVAGFGQAIASVNSGLEDQSLVEAMLVRQRDAVSGVSLDEEMTDIMRFQKAYQASAKVISTVDEMLDTVLNMKR
jgi:flagellar hook-associated protein 1 FlgK